MISSSPTIGKTTGKIRWFPNRKDRIVGIVARQQNPSLCKRHVAEEIILSDQYNRKIRSLWSDTESEKWFGRGRFVID
jgi:hypothetical protein